MPLTKPLKNVVRCVILDLDGTLLNTEGIVSDVLKVFLSKYGKQWDGREAHKIVGKTPFEASAAIVEDYGLPCSTSEFISGISPLFSDHCNCLHKLAYPLSTTGGRCHWLKLKTSHCAQAILKFFAKLENLRNDLGTNWNVILNFILHDTGRNFIDMQILGYFSLRRSAVQILLMFLETEFDLEVKLAYNRWCNIKALPGANRLIKHLRNHGVPMALASNSPRENIEAKISYHDGWKNSFSVIIGGDEVRTGKPSPEIFLEAAKGLKVEPSSCLVIEDSIPGVTAGKAAGMEVIAVPSLPKQTHLYTAADEVINSLLDLQLEKWGLPPFEDWVEGTLPIDPWCIGGPVIKGFGRGSKVLGIPTANLSTEGYSDLLIEHPSGVYFGWAGLSARGVYKMVMSIGWNPYFNNKEKTIEPWLLHDFNEDFYGEELRLVIVGYIRPEANFPSLESLVAKIQEDRKIAEKALDLPLYSSYKNDPYLRGSERRGGDEISVSWHLYSICNALGLLTKLLIPINHTRLNIKTRQNGIRLLIIKEKLTFDESAKQIYATLG
ncbi:bifunctional riboflavin kinase/FMN phosphatase [Senna tora]|uniref:riboflavin kinase n=1 Tax=Senna tora TaxID=362788 RepID=A0A834SHK3_9FABA|nr:bifunctional riboflavin kinase/FMN phosphatase [Senna tora]